MLYVRCLNGKHRGLRCQHIPPLEAGQLLTRLFGLVASLIGHYSIFLTSSSVLWEREREGGREGWREEMRVRHSGERGKDRVLKT